MTESWEPPIVFEGIDARPDTPISAAVFLGVPQYEVFYLNRSSTLRGFNFAADETITKPDSINERPALSVGSGSEMGAYWPYVVYQNANGTFREVVYDSSLGWINATMTNWLDSSLVPFGNTGTGITVLPAVSNYGPSRAADIVYRRENGLLSIFAFGGDDAGSVWRSGR